MAAEIIHQEVKSASITMEVIDVTALQQFIKEFPEMSQSFELESFLEEIEQLNFFITQNDYPVIDFFGEIIEEDIKLKNLGQEFPSICHILSQDIAMARAHIAEKKKQQIAARINENNTNNDSMGEKNSERSHCLWAILFSIILTMLYNYFGLIIMKIVIGSLILLITVLIGVVLVTSVVRKYQMKNI